MKVFLKRIFLGLASASFLTSLSLARAEERIAVPPELVGLHPDVVATFPLPESTSGKEGSHIAIFFSEPTFGAPLPAGEAEVMSCKDEVCVLRFKGDQTLKSYPLHDHTQLILYPIEPPRQIVQMIETGRVPRTPDIEEITHSFVLGTYFDLGSYTYNENSSSQNYDYYKFLRRRAWEYAAEVDMAYRFLMLEYDFKKTSLPTQGFYGNTLSSELTSQYVSLAYRQEFFEHIVAYIGGAWASDSFTTTNSDVTIIPTTSKSWWALLGAHYTLPTYLIGKKTSDFNLPLGRVGAEFRLMVNGSAMDSGSWQRGTTGKLTGYEALLTYELKTTGPIFWTNNWVFRLWFTFLKESLTFSGPAAPPVFPLGTTSSPTSNDLGISVGKNYEF